MILPSKKSLVLQGDISNQKMVPTIILDSKKATQKNIYNLNYSVQQNVRISKDSHIFWQTKSSIPTKHNTVRSSAPSVFKHRGWLSVSVSFLSFLLRFGTAFLTQPLVLICWLFKHLRFNMLPEQMQESSQMSCRKSYPRMNIKVIF